MRKTRSLLTTALIAAVLGLAASAASATDVPQSMIISATVQNNCTLFLNDFDFGPIDGLSGAVDSQPMNFNVTCNSGTAYSLAPDNGMNFGADADFVTDRAMSDGAGHTLPYELWTDLGQTTAWDSTNPITGTGNGDVQLVQPAVRIPGIGGAPGGNYTDTLGVTLTYN